MNLTKPLHRKFVFISILLIATILTVKLFLWRSIEAINVLGMDSLRWNFPYAIENLRLLYLCDAEDEFQTAISELENKSLSGQISLADQILLAQLYLNTNRLDEAESLLRQLLIENPDNRELMKSLGLLLLHRGDIQNCKGADGRCNDPLVEVHIDPRHAKNALQLFTRANQIEKTSAMLWLIHIAKAASGEASELAKENLEEIWAHSIPNLKEGAAASGVASWDLARGIIVGDFDGDGLLDIITASTKYPMGYFRNVGQRQFTDLSRESGLDQITSAFIISAGDIDNDGDLDLYVSRNAFFGQMKNIMLENDGQGHFSDVTDTSGTGNTGAGFVSAFADYDLDGDLDLFLANMSTPLPIGGGAIANTYGRNSNILYRNRGDGSFEDVTEQAGLVSVDSHLGAAWGDIDEDGDPDLYVTTHFGPNHLYINQGDGSFVEVAAQTGVQEPWSSFSGWFFDYNGDSHLDLLVPSHAPTEVVAKYNISGQASSLAQTMRLYRGDGKGRFEDTTEAAGLRVAASAMGANWGDINGDGYPDFYLGTGGPPLERLEPNLLFINRGDGNFHNATYETGTGILQKGHGISFADLDGDGWQDLYVGLGGAWSVDAWGNALFWNESAENNTNKHFAKVILRGKQSNSHGVGARVLLRSGNRTIMREISAGGGFGINPFLAEFGLGLIDTIDELRITWPGAKNTQTFYQLPVDITIIIEEGVDQALLLDPKFSSPMLSVSHQFLADHYGRPIVVNSSVDRR